MRKKAPFEQHGQGHGGTDGEGLQQFFAAHPQHVAEQDVGEVLVGFHFGKQHEAERKHAGEHDAHHGVFFEAAVIFYERCYFFGFYCSHIILLF